MLTKGPNILSIYRSPSSNCGDLHSMESSTNLQRNSIGKCISEMRQCQYATWREEKTEICCKKEELNKIVKQELECESYGPCLDDDSTQGYFEFEKYFADHKSLQGKGTFCNSSINSKLPVLISYSYIYFFGPQYSFLFS